MPSRPRLVAALAAAIAFAGVLGRAAGADDVLASITGVENDVRFRAAAWQAWTPAAIGIPVRSGDSAQTGSRSRAEITYKDGTILRISSTCTLQIVDQGQRVYRLLLGKLWARVTKRTQAMRVYTPSAIAAITGTEFLLEVLPDQSTQLSVLEGTVLLFPLRAGPEVSGTGSGPTGEGQPAAAPADAGAGGTAAPTSKRPELDETVSFGSGGQESATPARPVQVNAGQGAIARPDVPLTPAFQLNVPQVRFQESALAAVGLAVGNGPVLSSRQDVILETRRVTPPVAPATRVAPPVNQVVRATENTDLTKTQLQNLHIDPKQLQGSPITGSIKLNVKF